MAEAPICTVGFVTYLVGRVVTDVDTPVLHKPVLEFFSLMFSRRIFQWELVLALLLGSIFVAPFGALTTRLIRTTSMSLILGMLVTILGVSTLLKTFL